MKRKKICYLILAYNDVENLKRMCDRLNENSDFYIHIDKKSDITPFITAFKDYPNFFFIDEREKIYWGGFSIVQAELNLCEAALKQKEQYMRFVLLSGTDYPIKSNEYIHSFFSSQPKVEFIRGIDLDTLENKELFSKHIDYYQKHDYPSLSKTNSKLFVYYRALTNKGLRSIKLSKKIRHRKFDLFHGSQWWALTGDCLETLMGIYQTNIDDYKNFKIGMFASDEKFFHTLFFNSSYAPYNQVGGADTAIEMKEKKMMTQQTSLLANVHLIDASMTKWFDESDFPKIVNSDKLFVRKVNTIQSGKLLDLIDKNILKMGGKYE